MQSKAGTVAEYLEEFPAPRAVEEMQYGMPGYIPGEPPVAMASQ